CSRSLSVVPAPYVHRSLDTVIAHITAAGATDLKIAGHDINNHVTRADAVHLDITTDVLEPQISGAYGAERHAAPNVAEAQVAGAGLAGSHIATHIADGHIAGAGASQLHVADVARLNVPRAEIQSQCAIDPVGFQISRPGMEVEGLQRLGDDIARPAVDRDGKLLRHAHGELQVRVAGHAE